MDRIPILILKRDLRPATPGPAAAVADAAGAAEQRIAMGVVYFPNIVDTQGDFASEEEVRKAAYEFMRNSDMHSIDVDHDGTITACHVVESFIVRKGDPDFPVPGSWVVAIYIPDDILWQKVKRGELNGFSLEAMAQTFKDATPAVQMTTGARVIRGTTGTADGHAHRFSVQLDDAGKIIATVTEPYTDPATGVSHSHGIRKFSRTDMADDHVHRFTLIDYVYREPADA